MTTQIDPSAASAEQFRLARKIAERATTAGSGLGDTLRQIDIIMDILGCHLYACPLDLDAMATTARIDDVLHDIAGISVHLDRETGELRDCFLPRLAKREKRDVNPSGRAPSNWGMGNAK